MTNPIAQPLESFFARITLLNGTLQVVESQSSTTLSLLREYESDPTSQPPPFLYGSRVLLEDIGVIPGDRWRRSKPTEHRFLVKSEDVETEFQRVSETVNLLLVAQGYEAFETFMLDSVAYLHCAVRGSADPEKLRKWEGKYSPAVSLEDWQAYARWGYRGRNNGPLLDWIATLAPDVEVIEESNTLQMPLRRWFAAATEVRHAAIHSSGLVKADTLADLDPLVRNLLMVAFPGVSTSGGYVLHLSKDSVRHALEAFHNYGYAIHKGLSVKNGFQPAYSTVVP